MAAPPLPDPMARTEAAPLPAASDAWDARDARAEQITLPGPGEDSPPIVAGRYEVLGMLGSGGMGTVYHARDRELEEIVALKLLRKELAHSPGMLERFRREVKLARRVTHKNVARTFDIGEFAGDRFLTMELIEGEMLGAHLARRGRLEFQAQMLARGPMALWSNNTEEAAGLLKVLKERELPIYLESSLTSALTVAMTRTFDEVHVLQLARGLPATGRYPPRRLSFHAQIRSEIKLATNDIDGGLVDLRIADTNGLLDLMWLTRCPVFDVVRDHPEYQSILRSTTARAARVIEILEPNAAPYGA